MGDIRACQPDWREAQIYQPLLAADPSVWAWEFARRGLEANSTSTASGPGAPELCFVGEGPCGDSLPTPLWRWQADGSIPVLTVEPASSTDPAAIDLKALDVASLVVRTDDGDQHVLISDGLRRLRFAVVQGDVLSGPGAFRFHLPAQAMGLGALDGLRLLIGLRDTGRLCAPAWRPPAKAPRWLQILRAHDARQAGASHREIALSLFGQVRVSQDWAGGSDYMRMRVQRLVRAAEQAVAGGYRTLFGLRSVGPIQPEVAEVWRSPRWLGGLPPVALCFAIFLGTSFSPPQSRHASCPLSGAACEKSVEPSRIMALTTIAQRISRSRPGWDGAADSSDATSGAQWSHV